MESLICTVYNEEETIKSLLDSILRQTHLPDEVIFVDAQSTDSTFATLQSYTTHFKQKKVQYKLFKLFGNRSKGRNYAIEQAKGDIILVTDAGCVLDTNWVRNLIRAFTKGVSVVSGYYLPTAPPIKNKRDPIKKDSIFQRSLAAYTSTMPDILAKLGSSNFLPSSRSIAFKKSAWTEVKGYPENLNTAEDLTFARNLKESGAVFALAADAVVYWPQKSSFIQAFKQFFNYAFGDGQAFYFRRTTPFLYGRYVFGIVLLILSVIFHAPSITILCIGLMCAYIVWSIHKNYQYVAHWQAFFILPALQIISDIAVLSGMTLGIITHPVLKNTSLQLFGRLLTAGIGLLTTAMLARYLGPRSFGEYSFIFSISTAVFLFADLGLDTYIIRSIAHQQSNVQQSSKNVVQTVFSLRFYISTVLYIGMGAFLYFSHYSYLAKLGILIASLSSVMLLFSNILWSVFKGRMDYGKVVSAQVITSVIIVVLFAFGLLEKYPLIYFVIFHVFGFLGGFVLSLYCWDRPYKAFTLVSKQIKSLLIGFWPFIGIFVFATAYFKIDMILLGMFHPPGLSPAVGLYAIAYKPFEISIVLGGYFTQTLLPYFSSKDKNQERKQYNFFKKMTFLLALLAIAGLYIGAPHYIRIIGGIQYELAINSLRILSLASGITIVSGYFASKLLSEKREKSIFVISFIAFLVNIIANIVFIPQFSFIATSWITVLTQLIVLIGYSLL